VEWALTEQLVVVLADSLRDAGAKELFSAPDALKQFRALLRSRSGRRDWSNTDLERLYEAVKSRLEYHYREPIEYGDYLKLLWQVEHRCVECGKAPPDVLLHIDHIVPVALGGTSKRHNLQFLCSSCNQRKGKQLSEGQPWLELA
jgi:5-methylcytosine-specific restriction endonuclease McrA